MSEQGKVVCHGLVVIRSLTWPGSFTLYQNGKQTSVYVGDGIKFTDKLRPFPLAPPILNADPEEYEEFVLPEIKVLTPEEIKQKVEESFDELWGKAGCEGDAASADDAKKVFAELKGRVNGAEEAAEVNEEAVDEILGGADKDDDDKIAKAAIQALFINNFEKI